MLKSWEGEGGPCNLESAQGPNPSFILFIQLLFDLGVCWDQDLEQGLPIQKPQINSLALISCRNMTQVNSTLGSRAMVVHRGQLSVDFFQTRTSGCSAPLVLVPVPLSM